MADKACLARGGRRFANGHDRSFIVVHAWKGACRESTRPTYLPERCKSNVLPTARVSGVRRLRRAPFQERCAVVVHNDNDDDIGSRMCA